VRDDAPGLRHLPLALFAAPMGLGSLGFAWREAHATLGAPWWVGEVALLLCALAWAGLAALHAARILRHPDAFAADMRHPVRACFAAAATIGVFLVAGFVGPYSWGLAAALWAVGVVGQLAVAAWVVRGLLAAPREPSGITPALLLPLVGNILAPLPGAKLGFVGPAWMMFGVGALLWASLHPLMLSRLATGPALPPRLLPTVCILLAPPAVGSLSLAALTGSFWAVPMAVLGFGAFLALVLLTMLPAFLRLPFGVSAWAFTFPTGTFAAALLWAARDHWSPWMAAPLWAVLLAATAIVVAVAAGTLRAGRAGVFWRPEA
jgi:tellurite resistance protein